MMDKPLIVAKFHLYCTRRGRSKPYYRVLIFRDKVAMRAFLVEQRRLVYGKSNRRYFTKCLGCCTQFNRFKGGKRQPFIGTICLCLPHVGTMIITHEIAHAALYFVTRDRPKKVLVDAIDEPLAWVTGWLNAQFNRHYWRLNLHEMK